MTTTWNVYVMVNGLVEGGARRVSTADLIDTLKYLQLKHGDNEEIVLRPVLADGAEKPTQMRLY